MILAVSSCAARSDIATGMFSVSVTVPMPLLIDTFNGVLFWPMGVFLAVKIPCAEARLMGAVDALVKL